MVHWAQYNEVLCAHMGSIEADIDLNKQVAPVLGESLADLQAQRMHSPVRR
jgi:hypothetical protein